MHRLTHAIMFVLALSLLACGSSSPKFVELDDGIEDQGLSLEIELRPAEVERTVVGERIWADDYEIRAWFRNTGDSDIALDRTYSIVSMLRIEDEEGRQIPMLPPGIPQKEGVILLLGPGERRLFVRSFNIGAQFGRVSRDALAEGNEFRVSFAYDTTRRPRENVDPRSVRSCTILVKLPR